MAGADDLKGLSEAQLVQAYVEHAQAWEATEHIGKKNRLSDRNGKIVDELKTRGVALQALQRLTGHSNAKVRSNGENLHGWGPGGSLYFLLPEQDLLAHTLAGGEFDIQFT